MAFFPSYRSAPHLVNLGNDTYVIVHQNAPSEDDDDEEDEGSGDDLERGKSPDNDFGSVSGESNDPHLLSPLSADQWPLSESDASPMVMHRSYKKKRRAPMPPDMSPTMAERHSYAFDTNTLNLRTSTDTDSNHSESRLFYQTSTDSENMIPESARGSNFPGELAGVDNLHTHVRLRNLIDSPRDRSRFHKIREAFRSPQIGRRKSKKEKGGEELSLRVKKFKHEGSSSPKSRKSKLDEGSKSPRLKRGGHSEPMPEMSDWILAFGCEDVFQDHEFEVKRIPDYDKYLSTLLEETDPSHIDYEDLSKAAKRVHSIVKEREDELSEADNQSAMDAVQDRFPQDDLNLRNNDNSNGNNSNHSSPSLNNNNNNTKHGSEDKEKPSSKNKGLSIRRRSAPSAVIFKSLTGSKSKGTGSLWSNAGMGKKDHDAINPFKVADTDSNRMFIMEGPVQLAAGMQIQERYLFLFSDLLLVAKQKSNTAFKLKNRVQLCDMWIASCIEEVSETTRPTERSFVIGWPTTNVVATFPTTEVKDEWLHKLSERIQGDKLKDEGKSIQLKVAPKDIGSTHYQSCQMTINNVTQAKDVLETCLRQMSIPENEAKDFQLWVLSGKEGPPYPLIGHETPFSIKLSQVRELTRSRSRDDIDKMTAGDLDTVVEDSTSPGQKCEFYLKQKKTLKKHHIDEGQYQKSMKKQKKSPNIINALLRKIRPAQSLVFGLPLADICDDNFDPPESIMKLMVLVYNKGPDVQGILRRGNNAALGKEIKEKIDAGAKYNLEDHQAPTAASVFKEFIRSIPDGLLPKEQLDQWKAVKTDDPEEEKIEKIKKILGQLPPPHYNLVKLTISLLQHLAKYRQKNHMGPSNLATCIAPSFCNLDNRGGNRNDKLTNATLQQAQKMREISEVFNPLISFMIVKHIEIFDKDILDMFVKFGCEASPYVSLEEDRGDGAPIHPSAEEEDEDEDEEMEEEDEEEDYEDTFETQQTQKRNGFQKQQRQHHHLQRDSNSGTDSDSTHSMLSMPDTGMGFRRDDSSVDSLVDRDYFQNEPESSPKATKSHLSPSNLSRDSGLTLSDTMLYDEEMCHVDIANANSKLYQRSASHFVDRQELDLHNHEYCSSSMDARYNPVPPPRKRGVKKSREFSEGSDNEQCGYPVEHQRPPFKHSASTTLLDLNSKSSRIGEVRSAPTHAPFNKRISADSIGEEDEEAAQPQQLHSVDFMRIQQSKDIGTIVKSSSGTHLYLREEKYNQGPANTQSYHSLVRQSSVTDSTPPVSPQSRYSQSSRDSVISDSTYTSRDGSAPQTPDELPDKSLAWMRDIESSKKDWNGRLGHSLNIDNFSKSTSDLLSSNFDEVDSPMAPSSSNTDSAGIYYSEQHVQKYKPSSQKLWSGKSKSHEAEEINMSCRPHFSLMVRSEEYSLDQASPPSTSPRQHSPPPYKKKGLPQHLVKGSPPPNVILQSFQTPPRRDSFPLKASYDDGIVAQLRRSSADSIDQVPFDASKCMSSIRREEYQDVTPKPIIISPTESNTSASSATKSKLSKYVSSSLPLSLKDKDLLLSDSKRPERPPNYQQALQRNFMLKQNVPVDIGAEDDTEKQKEASARAKAIYEKSLQLYDEQRSSKTSTYNADKSKSDSVIGDESANRSGYSRDFAGSQAQPDSPDDSGASGFLDMGSISNSLQEDILMRRNARAGSDISSASRSGSAACSASVSRNDSKLSDTGSSSGSSVTMSTLSHHSDSFGRQSDISNVTLSSVTSSDSSSETSSVMSRRRSEYDPRNVTVYSRHFRPVEPDSTGSEQERNVAGEDEYVTLSKDPKQVYFESMQRFEQKASPVTSPTSSSSSITYQPYSSSSSQLCTNTEPSKSTLVLGPSTQPSYNHSIPTQNRDGPSAFRSRPMGSRTKSALDIPNSASLHRSRSDSAEHLNKLGTYSPRAAQNPDSPREPGRRADKEQYSYTTKTQINYNRDTSRDTNAKPFTSDIKSAHHQKFLKAKSYFYQPQDDTRNSPAVPSWISSKSSQQLSSSSSSFDNKQSKSFTSPPTSVTEDTSINSAHVVLSPRSKSSLPSKSDNYAAKTLPPGTSLVSEDKSTNSTNVTLSPRSKSDVPSKSNTSVSSASESKKEFPWSVKDLKSLYDKNNSNPDSNNSHPESTSSSTHPRRRSPPPYQDPPPFRRLQDNSRLSTSSTSSAGSDHSPHKKHPASQSFQKYGPQSSIYEAHHSYSSSEDGYSSSLDRRSMKSNGSSHDGEAISDYTNITYV